MPIIRDTIYDTLAIIRENLDDALNSLQTIPADDKLDAVVLGNIAFSDNTFSSRQPNLGNKIVITLLKIEEEPSLKNQPLHRRNPINGMMESNNPPIFLNLYLLITANTDDYNKALTYISRVVGFFQYQRVFTEQNSKIPVNTSITAYDFNLSLVSPSLEQLNHIWSILGGKQLPSVLYKMQLQRIEYISDNIVPVSSIQEIILNEQIL